MSPRHDYFSRRRQRLRRKKLCTRCGASARPGRTLCPSCYTVERVKKHHRNAPDPAANLAATVARLHERLDLIDEARRAVQAELDRVTA